MMRFWFSHDEILVFHDKILVFHKKSQMFFFIKMIFLITSQYINYIFFYFLPFQLNYRIINDHTIEINKKNIIYHYFHHYYHYFHYYYHSLPSSLPHPSCLPPSPPQYHPSCLPPPPSQSHPS